MEQGKAGGIGPRPYGRGGELAKRYGLSLRQVRQLGVRPFAAMSPDARAVIASQARVGRERQAQGRLRAKGLA